MDTEGSRSKALIRPWLGRPRARLSLIMGALGGLALVILLLWGVRRVPAGWTGLWTPDGHLVETGSLYLRWSGSSLALYPKRVNLDRAALRVGVGGDTLHGHASLSGELLPEVARAIASRRAAQATPVQATEAAVLQAINEVLRPRGALDLVESSPFPLEDTWLSVAGVERGLRVESSEIDLVSVVSLRQVAGRLLEDDGQVAADAFLVSVMSRRPGDPAPICVRADVARLAGESARAEILYLEALELDPLMPEPMAAMLARSQDNPDALDRSERLLQKALRIAPESVRHLNWTSLILAQRGDLRGAEAALVRALAIEPESTSTVGNLAALMDRQGRREEAIDRLQQALETHPDEPMLLYNLGSALAAEGDLQGALEALIHAERSSPPSVRLYARLAAVHEMLGNLEQAGAYRKRAEELQQARTNALTPRGDS